MLFAGDDWAEDHHDVELMDASGRVLARARLPEGAAGMARLSADLASGRWQQRYGHLLGLDELDLGYCVVIARP